LSSVTEARIYGRLLQNFPRLLAENNFRGAIALGHWLGQFPSWPPDLEKKQLGWLIYRLEQMFHFIEYDRDKYYYPSESTLSDMRADCLLTLSYEILRVEEQGVEPYAS
jgi:hypothetical protein